MRYPKPPDIGKFLQVFSYLLYELKDTPHAGDDSLKNFLYLVDFDFYEKREEQLMALTYRKTAAGPDPLEFEDFIEEMEDLGMIKNGADNRKILIYNSLAKDCLRNLPEEEMEVIDGVLLKGLPMSPEELREYCLHDIPYLSSDENSIIEYESVFYRMEEYSLRGKRES